MARIVVSGGSGYIGSALVKKLVERGDQVTVLTRGASRGGNPSFAQWDPYQVGAWAAALDGADAVVHLAGERAVGVRYTEAVKRRIYDSRVLTTRNVVGALRAARVKPSVLVSASAVGYYGDCPASRPADESAPPGSDFLARLCVDWEAASEGARALGVRVVNPRIGVVFGPGGGPLATMALPFKLFVGGKIGSGEQGVSWIHLDDAVTALVSCIDDPGMPSKVNVCSPNPASNEQIAHALAEVLGRPSWLSAPSFGLKALFGAGAEPILMGQFAVPAVLTQRGMRFAHGALRGALEDGLREA
jgi:uncharacterized protein